jgi:quercetin dioxygenase-like cupin family protein
VFNIAPGSFVLLPRGIPHWLRVNSDAPMRSLVMTTGQFERYVIASGEGSR